MWVMGGRPYGKALWGSYEDLMVMGVTDIVV